MGDLSDHFDSSEFSCHCGCGTKLVSPVLIMGLEDLRASVGKPIQIISGVRCKDHNANVHGKPDSRHLPDADGMGHAADITCKGVPLTRLYLLAAGVAPFHLGGIGIYADSHFIHVDIREKKARWGHLCGAYVPFLTAWEAVKREEGLA